MKHYAFTAAFIIAGVFASKSKAAEAAGEGGIVAHGFEDFLDSYSKAEIARALAHVEARINHPEASADEQNRLAEIELEQDKRFTNLKRTTSQEFAQQLFAACEQLYSKKPKKAPKAPKAPKAEGEAAASGRGVKTNVKAHIRELFNKVGNSFTLEEMLRIDDDASYSQVSVGTAISDLKNEKYCGKGGVIVIERQKDEKGVVSYLRTA